MPGSRELPRSLLRSQLQNLINAPVLKPLLSADADVFAATQLWAHLKAQGENAEFIFTPVEHGHFLARQDQVQGGGET